MRGVLLVAALLATPQVAAQAVYKCVDDKGRTAYMSHPCDGSSKTAKTYTAVPDTSEDQDRAEAELQRRNARAVRLSSIAGANEAPARTVWSPSGADERGERRAKCQAAKVSRDSTLQSVGLARTYDLLQKLDAAVYEACKDL